MALPLKGNYALDVLMSYIRNAKRRLHFWGGALRRAYFAVINPEAVSCFGPPKFSWNLKSK